MLYISISCYHLFSEVSNTSKINSIVEYSGCIMQASLSVILSVEVVDGPVWVVSHKTVLSRDLTPADIAYGTCHLYFFNSGKYFA